MNDDPRHTGTATKDDIVGVRSEITAFAEVDGERVGATGVDTYHLRYTTPANGARGVHRSGIFSVPETRRIVNVTYECAEGPCGWIYNPDGGYSINIRIFDGGTKAEWKRLYDASPATETYKVYWEVVT